MQARVSASLLMVSQKNYAKDSAAFKLVESTCSSTTLFSSFASVVAGTNSRGAFSSTGEMGAELTTTEEVDGDVSSPPSVWTISYVRLIAVSM